MREITHQDFLNFIKKNRKVRIENVEIKLGDVKEVRGFEPKDFVLENNTFWSFPDRGDWATHHLNSRYRGNWPPQIPRNLILKYIPKKDRSKFVILDPMVGSGTTLIECKLLGINGVGVDINPDAIMVTRDRLDFGLPKEYSKSDQKTYVGDARDLYDIKNDSIDMIATHPPYAGIINYSNEKAEGDLSSIRDIDDFVKEMGEVASECFRVLKPGKICAVLIGDSRKYKHYIPIAFRVMQKFLDAGFILKENIIKAQWKMKSTREKWRGSKYDFYLIAHENLFILRKPEKDESVSKFKRSMKWWD